MANPAAAARRWQQLYAAMLWLSVGAAVFTTLFGHWIVTTLYGPAFAPAAPVLAVHIWGGVNVALEPFQSLLPSGWSGPAGSCWRIGCGWC